MKFIVPSKSQNWNDSVKKTTSDVGSKRLLRKYKAPVSSKRNTKNQCMCPVYRSDKLKKDQIINAPENIFIQKYPVDNFSLNRLYGAAYDNSLWKKKLIEDYNDDRIEYWPKQELSVYIWLA